MKAKANTTAAPAKKTAAKKAAKKAPAPVAEPAEFTQETSDGTAVIFTGYRTEIEGDQPSKVGERLFVSSFNDDDGTYNVARTERGKPHDSLYPAEFRLASAEETKAGHALTDAKGGKTASEADNGGPKAKKDKSGKTVIPAKKAAKGAKPAKEPKPAKEVTPPEPIKVTASVQEASEEFGGLLEAAEELCNKADATDFTLGGILAKIEEVGAFETILDKKTKQPKYGTGHIGFGCYVDQHLGMKYRKAKYLIGNYVTCVRLGITEKQIAGIGWSKLKEAVGAMTEDNYKEILDEAKTTNFSAFAESMKTRKVNGGTAHGNTKANQTTYTFKVFNDKAEVWNSALADAMSAADINPSDADAKSRALDYIINEWIQLK